jgi:hypothetical protein
MSFALKLSRYINLRIQIQIYNKAEIFSVSRRFGIINLSWKITGCAEYNSSAASNKQQGFCYRNHDSTQKPSNIQNSFICTV